MASPLKLSLDDVRREAREEVAFLDELSVKHPDWDWTREMLVFAREFDRLASNDAATLDRAHDFADRVQSHIQKKRLKGMEPTIWRAQALEDIVREREKA